MKGSKFPSEPSFVLHFEWAVSACLRLRIDEQEAIAVGGTEGRVEVYEGETYGHKETAYVHSSPSLIASLSSSTGDDLLVHVRDHGVVILLRDQEKWIPARTVPTSYPGFCGSVVLCDSLFLAAVEGTSHSITTFALKSGKEAEKRREFRFDETNGAPTCMTSDGERVFVGSDSGSVMALTEDQKVVEISFGTAPVFAMATSSKHLAVGSTADSPIFVVEKEDLKIKALRIAYNSKAAGVSSLCFSPSESTLFGGFWDGSVRGFSVKSGRIVVFLDFHSQTVNSVLWLDARRLAVASKDARISIWRP